MFRRRDAITRHWPPCHKVAVFTADVTNYHAAWHSLQGFTTVKVASHCNQSFPIIWSYTDAYFFMGKDMMVYKNEILHYRNFSNLPFMIWLTYFSHSKHAWVILLVGNINIIFVGWLRYWSRRLYIDVFYFVSVINMMQYTHRFCNIKTFVPLYSPIPVHTPVSTPLYTSLSNSLPTPLSTSP